MRRIALLLLLAAVPLGAQAKKAAPKAAARISATATDSAQSRANTDSIRFAAASLLRYAARLDSLMQSPPVVVVIPPPPPDTSIVIVAPPPPPPPAPAAGPAALPLDSVTTGPTAVLRTVAVHAGDNLQTALNNAQRGDALVLDSGAVWIGNFTLPAKPGAARISPWVTITSSGALPPPGTRVTYADTLHMATIATSSGGFALSTVDGSFGWRIVGIHFRTAPAAAVTPPNQNYGIVGFGSFQTTNLALVPSEIILDRSVVHAAPGTNTSRCVALNSGRTAIVDSYLVECRAAGNDAQAILGANGPGPYLIRNNRLEGSGENVMFGGSDPAIVNLVPSDITIRANYFSKPLSWKTIGACGAAQLCSVKNLLEFKNARRVLVEGNVLENSWVASQTGTAITVKSTNQSAKAVWSTSQDLTFRYNVIHDADIAFNIAAHPEINPVIPAARITVENNLMYNIGTSNGTCGGRAFQLLNNLTSVTIQRNTVVHSSPLCAVGQFLILDSTGPLGPATGVVIDGNISTWGGPYGAVAATGKGEGTASLAAFAPGYVWTNNCIIGEPAGSRKLYPAGTLWAALTSDVFVSPTDFHVKAGAPCAGQGANVDGVLAATAGVAIP